MSYAYTPIMVSMASPVSEILLLLNLVKFPFWTILKNLNQWNQIKKSMQVVVDEVVDATSIQYNNSNEFYPFIQSLIMSHIECAACIIA